MLGNFVLQLDLQLKNVWLRIFKDFLLDLLVQVDFSIFIAKLDECRMERLTGKFSGFVVCLRVYNDLGCLRCNLSLQFLNLLYIDRRGLSSRHLLLFSFLRIDTVGALSSYFSSFAHSSRCHSILVTDLILLFDAGVRFGIRLTLA